MLRGAINAFFDPYIHKMLTSERLRSFRTGYSNSAFGYLDKDAPPKSTRRRKPFIEIFTRQVPRHLNSPMDSKAANYFMDELVIIRKADVFEVVPCHQPE